MRTGLGVSLGESVSGDERQTQRNGHGLEEEEMF